MKIVILSERIGILDFNGPYRVEDDKLYNDETGGFTYLKSGSKYFFTNKKWESVPIISFKESDYPKIHIFP
jgi:hypothetical protein